MLMAEQKGSVVAGGTNAPVQSAESSSKSCEECKANASKYKCPGCSVRSCSLPCVKAHKQRTGCTGKRQQTEFVPLSQFDNNLLLSDYNMLEDVKRMADSAKRMRVQLCGEFHYQTPFHLRNLLKAARSRRTQLLLLPSGMSKRETSRTNFNNRSKSIYWTIEWRFHSTDVKLMDHGVNENSNLYTVIENRLKVGPRNHPLKPFCLEPIESLKFFVSEHPKRPRSPFRELDINAPIRQQLTNLVVIEYPVIHVYLPSHSPDFEVVKKHRVEPKAEPTEPTPKGVLFREEEIKDDADPGVLDLMNQPHVDLMDFEFEPELIDVYSNLISESNPDDFLDLDGFSKQELEEGEIADSD